MNQTENASKKILSYQQTNLLQNDTALKIAFGFILGGAAMGSNKMISELKKHYEALDTFSLYSKTRTQKLPKLSWIRTGGNNSSVQRTELEKNYKTILWQQDQISNLKKMPENTVFKGFSFKEIETKADRLAESNYQVKKLKKDFVDDISSIVLADHSRLVEKEVFKNTSKKAETFSRLKGDFITFHSEVAYTYNTLKSGNQYYLAKIGHEPEDYLNTLKKLTTELNGTKPLPKIFAVQFNNIENLTDFETHTNAFETLRNSPKFSAFDLKDVGHWNLLNQNISSVEKKITPPITGSVVDALKTIQKTALFEYKYGNYVKYASAAYNKVKFAKKILPYLGGAIILATALYAGKKVWENYQSDGNML